MTVIDTDYLVIGAGAAGMAFTDSLIVESDADVVMVDRRHAPGGHWNDAYSFVRLHQPSPFYGVNSRVLGDNKIDEVGPNAGLYERATGADICDYFQRVLDEHLLPSGHVRFFGMCEYVGESAGEHRIRSRLTGDVTTVQVRRKVVDATYLETPVPSTHTPSFDVDPGVRMIPVNELVNLMEPATGFTVIGGGQDRDGRVHLAARQRCGARCNPLDPAARRPGSSTARVSTAARRCCLPSWKGCRAVHSKRRLEAENVEDLFARLESCGQLIRLDQTVEPTMYRCATVTTGELDRLRKVENVVRLGRVLHVGIRSRSSSRTDPIPTNHGQVHVDCSAAGLHVGPRSSDLRARTHHTAAGPDVPADASTPPSWPSSKRAATTTQKRIGCVRPIRIRTRLSIGSRARGCAGSSKDVARGRRSCSVDGAISGSERGTWSG